MGEYKGSGLALMIGLVAGVLNRAAFGRDVIDFNADDESVTIPDIVLYRAFSAVADFHRRSRSACR